MRLDKSPNRTLFWLGTWSLILVPLGLVPWLPAAHAQDAPVPVSVDAQPANAAGYGPGGRPGRRGGPQPGQPMPGQPVPGQPVPGQPAEGEKKEGEEGEKKEGEEKKDENVKRPDKPPRTPDPREFEVTLDAQGRVPPFNFIGQAWPEVLQWLANLSKSSLDWQELPSGYLNLTTQRAYTVDEVRDLVNRHLHARGYTMLQVGEVLSVFKIEAIDPSLVRRVTEEDLYDLRPYDFVKISFELPTGLEVEKAKEDVKQVLSPNAKIFPLATTRRLLVIDSVANLRLVSSLLNEERAAKDGRIVPKEFVLKHARPEQVIETLYVVLGMDPKTRPTQMELQMQQQQQMQMMQQMRDQGNPNAAAMMRQDSPPVHLAYNRQRNSVLANAPPEQMKIIERTIAYLDVPFGSADFSTGDVADSGGRTMKKYPLTTLDPENFVQTLEEIGGLSPYSEFKVDKKSRTLFALATDADHVKINELIGQFDGTGRRFEVIWLRRLPALAVAETVTKLMAGQLEEKEDDDDDFPWYFGRRRNEEEEAPKVQGFGVDADIENNRLLLWANEAELERVQDLLVKLGEVPAGEADPRQVRFVQPSGDVPTVELLERLRDAWSATGKNEIIIKMPDSQKTAPATGDAPAAEVKKEETGAAPDRSAALRVPARTSARLAQLAVETENEAPLSRAPVDSAEHEAAASAATESLPQTQSNAPLTASEPGAAPSDAAARTNEATKEPEEVTEEIEQQTEEKITITVTEDGRIILSSPDTAALDELEQLLADMSPPERQFRVFRLEHIKASNMYWMLYDFFEEDLKGETETMLDWFGRTREYGKKDQTTGLARRRKLMITYDSSSNTVMVANASARQLEEVQQLIAEYDRPASADSINTRRTAAVKIHYSKASVVANALKEVYRDLLSSRDREFDNGEQRERRQTVEKTTVVKFGNGPDVTGQTAKPIRVGFEGALSVGVDDVSNIVLISVQEELFDNVMNMVKLLDEEAAPDTTVQVHRLSGSVSAASLQKALDEAVGNAWIGGRPEQAQAQQQPGRNEENRDRDRGRRDRRRGDGEGWRGRRGND